MNILQVNEKEDERDDGIIYTVFKKRIVKCGDERETKTIHYIARNMESDHEPAEREACDEIGKETDMVEVFGIQKKIRDAIARSQCPGNETEKNEPE